jgi:glycosyltransferase involved in cell wall biosynthesis
VVDDPASVEAVRSRYARAGERIVGHFGTFDRHIGELLLKILPMLLLGSDGCVVLLLGRGSEAMRDALINSQPELAGRVKAAGALAAADLSSHLSACDMMIQPFIDGVSSRRTSVMVGLSHGVPIVTTSGRLTEPLWAESEAVMLAPVEDTTALVNAAKRLLADNEHRRRMSIAARALYDERFDIKRTVAMLCDQREMAADLARWSRDSV